MGRWGVNCVVTFKQMFMYNNTWEDSRSENSAVPRLIQCFDPSTTLPRMRDFYTRICLAVLCNNADCAIETIIILMRELYKRVYTHVYMHVGYFVELTRVSRSSVSAGGTETATMFVYSCFISFPPLLLLLLLYFHHPFLILTSLLSRSCQTSIVFQKLRDVVVIIIIRGWGADR